MNGCRSKLQSLYSPALCVLAIASVLVNGQLAVAFQDETRRMVSSNEGPNETSWQFTSAEIALADNILRAGALEEDNQVFCPIGLYTALRILELAAAGETRVSISRALSAPSNGFSGDDFAVLRDLGTPSAFDTGVLLHGVKTGGVKIVSDVDETSAFGKAGIRKGDVITHLNGAPVDGPAGFSTLLRRTQGIVRLTMADGTNLPEFQLPSRRVESSPAEKHFIMTTLLLAGQGVVPADAFLKELKGVPDTRFISDAFSDPEKGEAEADRFVFDRSGGQQRFKRSEIASAWRGDEPPLFVLFNQCSFNADWFRPFLLAKEELVFHSPRGETHPVFLKRAATFSYAETKDTQLVEIPFADGKCRCRIWLTSKSAESSIPQEFSNGTKGEVVNAMTRRPVEILIPRFQLSGDADTKSLVRILKLEKLIAEDAEFPGISEEAIVGEILQSATLDFNEKGVFASSKTTVVGVPRGRKPEVIRFLVDRPFVFEIVEEGDLVLFNGIVRNPEYLDSRRRETGESPEEK